MQVRPRENSDLPECVRALREVHESDGYPDRWPDDPATWLTPAETDAAWVAEKANSIVGHALLVRRDAALWVSRLFVRPSGRGSAVGTSLLSRMRDYADGRTLMLDVIERSGAAIALYERTGWSLVDRRPAGWIMADGTRPMERIYVAS
ncbi:GNAT family N-acetyltransferase [Rhodococcus sp. Eu-32]|uniref:GNAT family N-acetyltransferase n=1 Tax=Rhodococcus sp. Eu-32 TaxID=1017319 RepID=UPI000DF44F44|nr:GNAT family N-acetyltransferase [Rhodococcus sp. Eu-32]RRQ27818.1 GNAT family N-acetyltransferase [Rhodococcus sp. Eu-32]